MVFGYVANFTDIIEEYDKTNQAYLCELTDELGDEAKKWNSLFEDPVQVERDLVRIKDILFAYTIDNVVEFQHEINLTDNEAELHNLRNALRRCRELRNVGAMHAYEGIYDKFDATKVQERLREVERPAVQALRRRC